MNPFYPEIKTTPIFDSAERATLPQQKVYIPSFTVIVDSRQRDFKTYPYPSYYKIMLGYTFKNVTSIELKGSVIPRSSYNVHSTNNKIDFSIGSSITSINIINGGADYTYVPTVTIDPPIFPGIQATATAVLEPITKRISGITITNAGSGYSASSPPNINIQPPNNGKNVATATAKIGVQYTSVLREGQYNIGGNPTPPSSVPSGLILEIQDALNYSVNGGNYVSGSTSPFVVRLVSQYPELDAIIGSPESTNTNATQYNRIQITNINNDYWELMFGTGPNKKNSSNNLMGFSTTNHNKPIETSEVPTLIPAGKTLRANYDYDLYDDPKFIMLSFWNGNDTFERLISTDPSTSRKFASLIFDSNYTDAIKDTTGSTIVDDGINYLIGPVTKGPFWMLPGNLKPIKGFDYDSKKLAFSPPLGKLDSLTIQFTKYGLKYGGSYEYYNFQGRDNILIFEIQCEDQQSGMKS